MGEAQLYCLSIHRENEMVLVLFWEPWGCSLPLPLPWEAHPSPGLTAASGSSDAGKGVGQPPLQSYYCQCPPGCWAVKRKVREKAFRHMALDSLACGSIGTSHELRLARLTALEPRPQSDFGGPHRPQRLQLLLSMSCECPLCHLSYTVFSLPSSGLCCSWSTPSSAPSPSLSLTFPGGSLGHPLCFWEELF